MRRIRRLLIALVLGGVPLWAQQSNPASESAGRGGRHSEGWQRAMRLKGEPLPPKFPELGEEIERVVLANGMVVYLQEDRRLPLLDAVALVRTGTFYESAAQTGRADLAGELLRSGGTQNFPPERLEERLDFIAARLNVSMNAERGSVSLNVPSKDADEGLRILADVLRRPLFEPSRVELAKRQKIFSLRASNDTPGSIIRREFSRLLFTESHPAGRTPTVNQVEQMSRDDLIQFHERYFHPNQILLGLSGDFIKTEMLEKVRDLFGDWPRAEVDLPPLPEENEQPKPGIYYVQKDVNQSNLRIGHWGTNRDNPDRFAIDLMNDILGGSSFSSRIASRVRNDEGLAYSVGTGFPTNQRYTSLFLAAAQTKTESTVQAIRSIVDEIRRMRNTPISQNEFQTAKEMFLYSYIFRFDEPAQSLAALLRLEYEGLPADYLETEYQGYLAVTPEDIQRVAREYLHPDQLTIFIVGNYPEFAEELSKLGQPQEIEPLQFDEAASQTDSQAALQGSVH